jgi:hypothetical protein
MGTLKKIPNQPRSLRNFFFFVDGDITRKNKPHVRQRWSFRTKF